MTIRKGTKLWSKYQPGLSATVVAVPDYRGLAMAWHDDPDSPTGQCSALINVEEWSERELVPLPETVEPIAYVVITGTVEDPTLTLTKDETTAAVTLSKSQHPIGYARILIEAAMTPPQ